VEPVREPTGRAERIAGYELMFRRSLIVGPALGVLWVVLAIGARGLLAPSSWAARYGMLLTAGWGLIVWAVVVPVLVWRLLRAQRRRP
jgi:hypothetical protein